MASIRKKMGLGTIALGAFDWFARYQTGRHIVSAVTSEKAGTFLSQGWISPVLIVIGLLIFFWEKIPRFAGDETNADSSHGDSSVTNSGNSTATGGTATATGIGALHLHGFSAPPPQPTPPSLNIPRREPNLKYVGQRIGNLSVTRSENNANLGESSQKTGVLATIASFRNMSVVGLNDVRGAFGVYARLFFKRADDTEINTGIDQGCWLDSWDDFIHIPLDATKHVVLFARQFGNICFVPYKRGKRYGQVQLNVQEVHHIDVILVDENGSHVLLRTSIEIEH